MRSVLIVMSVVFGVLNTSVFSQTATVESPKEITGIYNVRGENYEGTVTIRKIADSYTLTWTLDDAVHQGIGMRKGNLLASSWPGGVVVYEIGADGRLSGQYPGNDGRLQREMLTFVSSLPSLPPPRAWRAGETPLVNWSRDEYWYPATVKKAEAARYYVVFDDGDEEWTTAERMTVEDLREGDRVFGNWQKRGLYYPGRIFQRRGLDIHIKYDDGDEENTTLSVIRVLRPRTE